MTKKKRRKWCLRKFKCPRYICETLSFLKPPDDIRVSEWAAKYRVLDSKSSAIPGKWSNDVTPYLAEVMDEFSEYKTEKIVFCKSTQVGGTEALQNMLGYSVMQDAGPAMIVYPTDTLIERTVQTRLLPMINSSPHLCKKIDRKRSGNDGIHFDNMFVTLAGSNSPSGLASTPIRYLFLDEVDKYPSASKKEADPISLAKERTKTFRNRKIYITSTPTLRTGQIWKEKNDCDEERHYFVPCPHCGELIELKFSNIKWPAKEEGLSIQDRAEQAYYACQKCGSVITDMDKPDMLRKGVWKSVRKETEIVKSVAFWINTLYSPFVTFSQIALEFMRSKDDPEKLQNFTNSWLTEPWEDTKLKTSKELVLNRQTHLPQGILPDWTKILVGGVDVQESSIYWTIRAFGDFITSQNVVHGQSLGWDDVVRVMNMDYSFATLSGSLVPELVLIDSGDQTDAVYEFCAMNSDWALPCKGMPPRQSHYTISTVNKKDSKAFGQRLVLVDGGKYKDMIAARLSKPLNANGAWMVHDDCDEEYANQVTAEHKIAVKRGGKEVRVWTPKTSHADNHYLDAEVYAFCAADLLDVRLLFLQSKQSVETIKKEDEIVSKKEKLESKNWFDEGGW